MQILEDGTTITWFTKTFELAPDGQGTIAKIIYPDGRRVFAYPHEDDTAKAALDTGSISDQYHTRRSGFDPNQPRDEQGQWTTGAMGLVDPQTFVQARDAGSTRSVFLSQYSAADLVGARTYLSKDGKTGYLLDRDGDLQNVFNNGGPKGAGREAITQAIEQGATTLDCFDGYLPTLYAKYGFVETGRMVFNEDYKPQGWDVATLGKPDVVFMAYQGGPRDTIRERLNTFAEHRPGRTYHTDWEAAKADSRRTVRDGRDDPHTRGVVGSVELGSSPGSDSVRTDVVKAVSEAELSPLVRLASHLEPALRRRFLDALRSVQNTFNVESLAAAIQAGNLTRAEALMHFGEWPEIFGGLAIDLRAGFMAGTSIGMRSLAEVGMTIGFRNVDEHAVRWAMRRLPPLVASIKRGAKEMVREIMTDAAEGKYTAFTAAQQVKDWVGLTGGQTRALANFKLDLIARGIAGAALSERVALHRKALIRDRAENIARNEIMSAANNGQLETWFEAERQGLLSVDTKKSWLIAEDERLCPVCENLGAAEPVGLHEQFVYDDGSLAYNVFDEPLYAPTQHPRCRCTMVLVFP